MVSVVMTTSRDNKSVHSRNHWKLHVAYVRMKANYSKKSFSVLAYFVVTE